MPNVACLSLRSPAPVGKDSCEQKTGAAGWKGNGRSEIVGKHSILNFIENTVVGMINRLYRPRN
jgi:hypothetical protein